MCRAAADKGAQEEAERQLAVVKKLKAEVTRKEGMLKATQADLDKVPCQSTLSLLLPLQPFVLLKQSDSTHRAMLPCSRSLSTVQQPAVVS